MKITQKTIELISELSKNAKKSDRDIAKSLNISQPTVTRMRKRLEDKKYITEYTTILDLSKLGFEIISFIFFKTKKSGGKS
jgi:DNA-binding Lrp family transcriptional regulator